MALSYSSRWEIIDAIKQIAVDVKEGKISPEEITHHTFQQYLTTKNIPDPELIIRTSGEYRISNFLLYQLAYSELYFTNTRWPEFRKNNLHEAIIDFQNRERRFGKTGNQIKEDIVGVG
jgi:undecaprenyl diphosphate synthase